MSGQIATHADARENATRAADSLMNVAQAKAHAAKKDPGADTSAENAARARREGWPRSGGPRHTSQQ
jgi:hypothetical protein